MPTIQSLAVPDPADPAFLICADGTRRRVTSSAYGGAEEEAARQAHYAGLYTNYPLGLQELAEAESDGCKRLDVLVRRRVQVQLAAQQLAKSDGLTERELQALKAARKRRQQDEKAGYHAPRKHTRSGTH